MASLCREFGISRRTGYKIFERYEECGLEGLSDLSSPSLCQPTAAATVRFKAGATILEMFGISKGGKEYRRVIAAFERIFGATIFFGTEGSTATSKVVHRARFNFMRDARIWYEGGAGEENVVVLSSEFFSEVMAHPIPADLDAIALLAASPGALDLFLWLSYRSFTAKDSAIDSSLRPVWVGRSTGLRRILPATEILRPN